MTETSNKKIDHVNLTLVGGDLRLRGEEGDNVFRIQGDIPSVTRSEDGSEVSVQCGGDCDLRIPSTSSVKVATVGGDAKITNIEEGVTIATIGGDLVARHLGDTTITAVGGDLSLRNVSGAANVASVGGDMDCRHVDGDLHLKAVGGDVSVRDINGSVVCNDVGGDMLIDINFEAGHTYEFHADKDIFVNLFPGAEVTFILEKGTQYELDELESYEQEIKVETAEDIVRIIVGGGQDASVTIESEEGTFYMAEKNNRKGRGFRFEFNFGDIMNGEFSPPIPPIPPVPPVPPVPPEFGDFGEYISQRVNEQVSRVTESLPDFGKKWGKKFSSSDRDRIRSEARHEAEQARHEAHRARHEAERARRDAERERREAERNRRDTMRGSQRAGRHGQPQENAELSEKERMMILSMLEEGKITVEEAERLLRTMEGK